MSPNEEVPQTRNPDVHESYTDPNFDLQKTLDELGGPFIEIGGPSKPYAVLEGVELPQPLMNANIPLDHIRQDASTVDFWGDARHLPFPDEGVGAIFVSALSRVDDTTYAQDHLEGKSFHNTMRWQGELLDLLKRTRGYDAAVSRHKEDMEHALSVLPKDDPNPAMQEAITETTRYFQDKTPKEEEFVIDPKRYTYNPMISLLLESQRAIKTGGLLVVSGILNGEVEILQHLGFEIKATKTMDDVMQHQFGNTGEDEHAVSDGEDEWDDEIIIDEEPSQNLPWEEYWAREVIFEKKK